MPSIRQIAPLPSLHDASDRYSIKKFLALQQYVETTSRSRAALVVIVTPISALLVALLPSIVPLQDPLAGLRANPGYFVDVSIICFIVALGMLMHWHAASDLTPEMYTSCQALCVALVAAVLQFAFVSTVSFLWRFPIPMSWVVATSVTGTVLAVGHLVVFRERCWRDTELISSMRRYMPAMLFQCIQIVIYPAFSVLFDRASTLYQVLLTLLFPLIKFLMKKGLRRYTQVLQDHSSEVAVTGIEICASLYQSMILQNSPSNLAIVIIMVVDVVQGLVVIRLFMDHRSTVGMGRVMGSALEKLRSGHIIKRIKNRAAATKTHPLDWGDFFPTSGKEASSHSSITDSKQEANSTACVAASAVTSHALELAAVAEVILLVEYLDVAVPLTNTCFVLVSCQFSAAQYNPRLRNLYFHPAALAQSMRSMFLYTLLQALSLIGMQCVMKYRYGMSAMFHLAFILERHWYSIVGKMIAWLPIILHFTVIHFGIVLMEPSGVRASNKRILSPSTGVDFSFRFDFAEMLKRENDR